MPTKSYENDVFVTWLDASGIVYTRVKTTKDIELKHAQENTEFLRILGNNEASPLLVDLREIGAISREARDHFSMKGRKGYATAIALLIKSPVSKVIGNFFLGLNKPEAPTKLFTKEEDAKKWLIKNYLRN